jgi:nicotinamidase-related amidase
MSWADHAGRASLQAIDPATAALLVIDMQNGFCHPEGTLGISGVDVTPLRAVIPRIRDLVGRFAERGLPILWTVQYNLERDATRERRALPHHTSRRRRVVGVVGTWDAELVEELAPLASRPELVIVKHRFGGFFGTRLEVMLRMLGVQALFVTGVAANTCVDTTIREAYMRDYDVVAVTDCIGALRPDWGRLALQVWEAFFAVPATSADVAAWLGRRG